MVVHKSGTFAVDGAQDAEFEVDGSDAFDAELDEADNQQVSEGSNVTQDISPEEGTVTQTQQKVDDVKQESKEPEKDPRIADLEEKLGVKIEDLGKKEEPKPEQTEQPKIELKPEQEQWFEAAFEKKFGLKPDAALEVIGQLQTFQAYLQQAGGAEALAQFHVQQQERALQNDWGIGDEEFQYRMSAIRSYYKELPTDKQAALDNTDGARLIWAYLEQDLGKGQQPAKFQRSTHGTDATRRVTQPGNKRKLSDLLELSDEEYSKIDWNNVTPGEIDYDINYVDAF